MAKKTIRVKLPPHRSCETRLTREMREGKKDPERSLDNWKPFRTKSAKTIAKETAKRNDFGYYVSKQPTRIHPAFSAQRSNAGE